MRGYVARRTCDGELRDPALVTETIAQTLGAKDGVGEHIAEREMLLLLLLDNLDR